MQLDPYLIFDGNCAEAARFYERVLGAKLEMISTFGEAPGGQAPPGSDDRIMHARLSIEGRVLMASDGPAGMPYEGMKGFSLSLNFPNTSDAKRFYDALSDDGNVTMPFQKTFWAEAFAMFTDRFGTPWMVNVDGAAK